MTRITDGWQTKLALIGDRFQLVYLALGSTSISADAIKEFRFVLDNRLGVTVESVKLLGRVMSADVKVTRSAPLLGIFGEYIVAGTPAVTFKLTEVYLLDREPSLAQTISGGAKEVIATVASGGPAFQTGVQLGTATRDNAGNILPSVGEQVGRTVAAIINPLIVPAILLGGAYLLISGRAGRGTRFL